MSETPTASQQLMISKVTKVDLDVVIACMNGEDTPVKDQSRIAFAMLKMGMNISGIGRGV